MNTKTILVVDDDPGILDATKFILEDVGYKVIISEKGEYAEDLHNNQSGLPDLIVLDVLLSGKDGREICKLLKTQKDTKNIPVIMMSAHPKADESVKKAGADGFLAKPFEIGALLNTIKSFI